MRLWNGWEQLAGPASCLVTGFNRCGGLLFIGCTQLTRDLQRGHQAELTADFAPGELTNRRSLQMAMARDRRRSSRGLEFTTTRRSIEKLLQERLRGSCVSLESQVWDSSSRAQMSFFGGPGQGSSSSMLAEKHSMTGGGAGVLRLLGGTARGFSRASAC